PPAGIQHGISSAVRAARDCAWVPTVGSRAMSHAPGSTLGSFWCSISLVEGSDRIGLDSEPLIPTPLRSRPATVTALHANQRKASWNDASDFACALHCAGCARGAARTNRPRRPGGDAPVDARQQGGHRDL